MAAKRVKIIPVFYTLANLASLTTLSTRTLWRMLSTEGIPGLVKVGRVRLFHRTVIDSWVREGMPPKARWEALIRAGKVKR